MSINYNNKVFRSIVNDDMGDVTSMTTFHYKQTSNVIWGVYDGGNIIKGTFTGKVLEQNKICFYYQHANIKGEIKTGYCESIAELRSNGRIRLFERWKLTCDKFTEGTSMIEEVIL